MLAFEDAFGLAPIWLASCSPWPVCKEHVAVVSFLALGQSSPDFTRALCICPAPPGLACSQPAHPAPALLPVGLLE